MASLVNVDCMAGSVLMGRMGHLYSFSLFIFILEHPKQYYENVDVIHDFRIILTFCLGSVM